VSPGTRQVLVAFTAGLVLLGSVTYLSRRGRLSFRYSFGWILVAGTGIVGGTFAPFARPVAELLGVSTAALLTYLVLLFTILISVQLSISISGIQKQIRQLAEEIAIARCLREPKNEAGSVADE